MDLPPGPRLPSVVQTAAWWTRTVPFLERCRARYGKRFTIRLVQSPPFVHHSEPDHIREIFTAPPEVLHPGEGAKVLEPVVGANSVILLDERAHLSQRKLMLPAFHGETMQRLSDLMREVTERELARWPRDEPLALHPRLQALTLEIVLHAVFGLESGERLDVLAMLLEARHEDGSPMSPVELRDELMTLLVAGHETTASELAWAFERLARSPDVVSRLTADIDAGDDDAYLTATIHETLRRRPVLPNAAPRLVMEPVEIGGRHYKPGVCLLADAYLLHHDADIYPDPYTFRPERFLDEQPGTYTWIPFGGGRRPCLGSPFAVLEMKIVLRAALEQSELAPAIPGTEGTRRRSITLSPRAGARTILHARRPGRVPAAA